LNKSERRKNIARAREFLDEEAEVDGQFEDSSQINSQGYAMDSFINDNTLTETSSSEAY